MFCNKLFHILLFKHIFAYIHSSLKFWITLFSLILAYKKQYTYGYKRKVNHFPFSSMQFHKINEQYLLLSFQTYFYVFTNQYKKIDKYSVPFISVTQSCQFFVIPLTKACQLPWSSPTQEFFTKYHIIPIILQLAVLI